MNRGKTYFRFQVNLPPEKSVKIISKWLTDNKYTFRHKYNEDMFFHSDVWYGKRGFQYRVTGNVVEIYAFLISRGRFVQIDAGAIFNMSGDNYKETLTKLFAELNYGPSGSVYNGYSGTPNNGYNGVPNNGYYGAPNGYPGAPNPYSNLDHISKTIKSQLEARQERDAIIAFVLSIIGLVLILSGRMFGVLLYILVFYMAYQGLKGPKRQLSVAALVILVISLVILVTVLLIMALFY